MLDDQWASLDLGICADMQQMQQCMLDAWHLQLVFLTSIQCMQATEYSVIWS